MPEQRTGHSISTGGRALLQEAKIERYAEVYVYEPVLLPEGTTEWRQLVGEFDPMLNKPSGCRRAVVFLGRVARLARIFHAG